MSSTGQPNESQNNTPSRRTVLKQGSAAAVAGGAVASSLGSRAHAAGSDTIKIGLIGCGGRGGGAANQAMSTSGPTKLTAMADAFDSRLQTKLEQLKRAKPDQVDVPSERQYTGLDAYQKLIDDDNVDLVILTTPPGWRPVHFEYVVNKGKNVFMEKPVATDAPGIRRVLAAAEKAKKKGLKVGVGLQRHHQRTYQETIKRLHDGEIGDIHTLHVYWNGGGVWTRPRKEGMSEMEYQTLNWYYFNWLCGDHITEQHIHNLDVGNWVKGMTYPVAARGMGGREVRTSKQHGQIFDHHAVEFLYRDGSRMFSQCRHIKGCWNSVSEWAVGTKGSAAVSGARIYSDPGFKKGKWRFRGDSPNPYQVEHDVLFDAIRNNHEHNEAERGAMSTMCSILGRMATYSGQFIRMSTAMQKGKELAPGIDSYDMQAEPPVKPNEDGSYPVPVPGEYNPFEEDEA